MSLILSDSAKEIAQQSERKQADELVRNYSLRKCDFQIKLLDELQVMEALELVAVEMKNNTVQKVAPGYRVMELTKEQAEQRRAQLQEEKEKLLRDSGLIS